MREAGGIYLEMGLTEGGAPLEWFLVDPPHSVKGWGSLSPVGVSIVRHPKTGVYHVLDWIGEEHYPNVADFIEEVRRFGLSRRVRSHTNFGLLTKDSRILCVHVRGLSVKKRKEVVACPGDLVITKHNSVCVGGSWWDLSGGVQQEASAPDGPKDEIYEVAFTTIQDATLHPRFVRVTMPSFHYYGYSMLPRKFTPAIFASFPISRIVGIEGGGVEDKLSAIADKVPFPCMVVPD